VNVRAAVRSGEKARALDGEGVTTVDFDYERSELVTKAVQGVDKIFLATPFSSDQVELASRLVDAAKQAGVKRIVKLSAIGCEQEPGIQLGRWHRAIEKKVEASGIAWTFLRPNNFYENFINYYGPDAQGTIYLPCGQAAASFIAGGDIALAARAALTQPGHEGKVSTLTGPEALTIAQAAKVIGEVSGRTVTYVDVPEESAKQAMLGFHMPPWMVDAMMELHAVDKAGYAAAVTDDFTKLTGDKPRRFAMFARENAAKWRSAT
jgi:uncharacterized protein YbjT (DUF2867 family)